MGIFFYNLQPKILISTRIFRCISLPLSWDINLYIQDAGNVISTSVGNSNNCPSGFVSYWYGCYRLETGPKSFATAQSECNNLNSKLVSIHDEAENAAVFALSQGNVPLWIGLKKVKILFIKIGISMEWLFPLDWLLVYYSL